MNQSKTLVLFDFDGTITTKDSLVLFIRYCVGFWPFALGFIVLLPRIVAYKLGLLRNSVFKLQVLNCFFGGWKEADLQLKSQGFVAEVIPNILRKEAMEKLAFHQKNHHRIIVVSASIENYLLAWCSFNNLECLATQLDFANGRFTGNYKIKNCYGVEKVRRITELVKIAEYEEIYAYGDTVGDKEMLELATKPFYRRF